MKRMIVIGIGNRLMMDDSIGVKVVDAIQNTLSTHGIIAFSGETDFQYCLNKIGPNDILVIIDAIYMYNEPGSIDIISLREAFKQAGGKRSQHEAGLIDAISLHYPNVQGYLIGIEVDGIGFGCELSTSLQVRFNNICTSVTDQILKIKGISSCIGFMNKT